MRFRFPNHYLRRRAGSIIGKRRLLKDEGLAVYYFPTKEDALAQFPESKPKKYPKGYRVAVESPVALPLILL